MDPVTKAKGKGDAGTRGRGDAEKKTLAKLFAVSPRPRVPASLIFAFCLFIGLAFASCASNRAAVSADATSGHCPVCKMKVQANDPWAAEIYYSDGAKIMFETPGDMVTFYFAPEKYDVPDAQKNRANITKVLVKDYQSKQQIAAREATLVYKGKIESPMGPDFVPFSAREAAQKFVAENGGTLVALDQVTSEMVQNLRKK